MLQTGETQISELESIALQVQDEAKTNTRKVRIAENDTMGEQLDETDTARKVHIVENETPGISDGRDKDVGNSGC